MFGWTRAVTNRHGRVAPPLPAFQRPRKIIYAARSKRRVAVHLRHIYRFRARAPIRDEPKTASRVRAYKVRRRSLESAVIFVF